MIFNFAFKDLRKSNFRGLSKMRKVILLVVLLGVFTVFSKVSLAATNCSCDTFVDPYGAVGIATSTPAVTLDVAGTIRAGGTSYKKVAIVNAGGTTNWVVGDNPWSWGAGKFHIAVDENTSPELTIQSADGYIGIATSTPAKKLEVSDSAVEVARFTGSGAAAGIGLKSTATGGLQWNLFSSADAASEGGGKLLFNLDGTGTKMLIDSSGRVGIGTTTPDRKLEIIDSSDPQLRLTHTDASKYTDLKTDTNQAFTVESGGDVIIKLGRQ